MMLMRRFPPIPPIRFVFTFSCTCWSNDKYTFFFWSSERHFLKKLRSFADLYSVFFFFVHFLLTFNLRHTLASMDGSLFWLFCSFIFWLVNWLRAVIVCVRLRIGLVLAAIFACRLAPGGITWCETSWSRFPPAVQGLVTCFKYKTMKSLDVSNKSLYFDIRKQWVFCFLVCFSAFVRVCLKCYTFLYQIWMEYCFSDVSPEPEA